MTSYFITGGAGFIGSHFCKLALSEGWCDRLTNLDALTYAGNLENTQEIKDASNYKFVREDLTEAKDLFTLLTESQPDVVVHFAAESHVDRSIEDPTLFLRTNILGTHHLLKAAYDYQKKSAKKVRFLFVSTDEVYGSLGATGSFYETTPFSPRSPYSVSKAAADMLSTAFHHTYGLDSVIVRCSNNYGPNQFPEKLIPQTIILAMQGKKIPVYGTGLNIRDWIYVQDFARGVQAAIQKGVAGEAYNFGGNGELTNLEVVKRILKSLHKPESLIEFVTDRKGHDFRYAMNFDKSSKELGWSPKKTFESGLNETVEWYQKNEKWWRSIVSGEYSKFFDLYYGARLKAKGL